MVPTTKDVIRFWSKLAPGPNGCWFFTGSLNQAGYGRTPCNGKNMTTHRFMWLINKGPIPSGQFVCHKCNCPPCCNPNHLFLGTPLQNSAHRVLQGRVYKLPNPKWRRLYRPTQKRGRTAQQRFWDLVEFAPNGCWIWKGSKTPTGHGYFTLNGKQPGAHRYAWELLNGPIPKGLYVMHNCPGGDNPSCVNPKHLLLGTARDNSRDAVKKGRMKPQAETLKRLWREKWSTRRGESHPQSKLTAQQVIEMRRLHSEEGWGYKRLHKHFGISFGLAQRIINRKAWKSI